jgi:hypothetical protein
MVITITSSSTKAEIAAALKKLHLLKITARRKSKKTFDAHRYCGVIKQKQDPLQLQKKWRNEWE